jgi:hypothetical protein
VKSPLFFSKKWPSLLSALLLGVLLVMGVGATLTHAAGNGLDPNMLTDPASYDTRPCAAHPSAGTCNGLYPVSPQNVSPAIAVPHGAGACIDAASKVVEDQQILDGTGQGVGHLQLRWMPTCLAYHAYVSFDFPISQVTSIEVWVQTDTYNWWDQLGGLPPQAGEIEQTGSVPGSALARQELYSPLIYAPSDNVSAHIDIERADGASFGEFTGSYSVGVFQYTGA